MELSELGLDGWLEQRVAEILGPGDELARVTAVDRGSLLVRNRDAEVRAELAGRLRFATGSAAELPCVGDWVCVRVHAAGDPAIIHGVVPRRTFLRRKRPGRTIDHQMIAANIDVAFIVQACHYDFNLPRLDRYLVMSREGGIEPSIILSKTDLIPPEQLERLVSRVEGAAGGSRVLALSNATGAGVEEFRQALRPGRTYCLLGSSGVGKTTLINRLLGREALQTRAVSGTGEGVHTTTRRHLLLLEGGAMLIDTPGMRELGLLGTADGVDENFADFHELALACRFPNCTHVREPGCAILAALERGDTSPERYRSFLKLVKETAHHDLSYLERRRKDRAFGRFIKSAKKTLRNDNRK